MQHEVTQPPVLHEVQTPLATYEGMGPHGLRACAFWVLWWHLGTTHDSSLETCQYLSLEEIKDCSMIIFFI